MRKYRGLSKAHKWVYGWYAEAGGRSYITSTPHESGFTGGEILTHDIAGFIEVIPETVGQFSGIFEDMNVWDGDIITFLPIDRSTGILQTARVHYDEERTAFCVKSKAWSCPLSFCRKIKVISNIHQNLGLLGE